MSKINKFLKLMEQDDEWAIDALNRHLGRQKKRKEISHKYYINRRDRTVNALPKKNARRKKRKV